MESQWPGQPPPRAGDQPDPPCADSPPKEPPPPGQPLHGRPLQGDLPPPGQPLHGQPVHRQPAPGRPTREQRPPRSPASDNRFYAVLLAVAAVVVVLGIGGCAVLSAIVDDSVEETSRELNDTLRRSQNRNSITDAQAKGVNVGDDRNLIVRRFGPPRFGPAKQPAALPPDIRDCISWHMRDGRYGSVWQFCFRDGKLVSKESTLDPAPRDRRPPPPSEGTPSQEQ